MIRQINQLGKRARQVLLAASGVFGILISASGGAQVGDLAKMKLYRNYYTIKLASPSAHQIEVWYQSPDQFGFMQWDWDNIGIQIDQDLSTLTKDDFVPINVAIAGWPKPPEQFETIPADLEAKRAEIESAIKRIHSDKVISNVTLVYNGYLAKLNIDEYVPIAKTDDGIWIGQSGSREFFVNFVTNSMKPIGASGSGFGLLFYGFSTEEQVNALTWFDFEVPDQIVGSSILSLDYELERSGINQIHIDTFAELNKRLMLAAVQLQAGNRVDSSLESILLKQGDAVLPENLKQYFEFEVSGYGRVGENSAAEQMDVEARFILPLKDSGFSFVQKHERSGFEFLVTGNLLGPTPSIQVSIANQMGPLALIKATIGSAEMKIVRSGNSVMAMSVPMSWENEGEVVLPGFGEFTEFDFYMRGEMLPSRLTGIETH